jgi:gliding motility-associated-like protein
LPAIKVQPTGVSTCEGTSAGFDVKATGTGITYQWQKDGENIGGATSSLYFIDSALVSNAGSYDVVVSGICPPAVTSNVIKLIVNTSTPVLKNCTENKSVSIPTKQQDVYTIENNDLDPIVEDSCNKYILTYTINGSSHGYATRTGYTTLYGDTFSAGTYQIVWEATDSMGQKSNLCSCEFTVNAFFFVPNYFTPNGDRYNDTWQFSLEALPGADVKVYNLWGILVYDSKGITEIDWDGRNMQGLDCPSDGYQYLITIGNKVYYKGTVTILR